MKLKKRWKDYKFIIIMFSIVVLFMVGYTHLVYYLFTQYDKECLEPYAQEYCKSINATWVKSEYGGLHCKNPDYNPRKYSSIETMNYQFLESEKEKCSYKGYERYSNVIAFLER